MLAPTREAELERYLRVFCDAALKGRTQIDAVETVRDATAAIHSVLADAAQRWNATVPVNLMPPKVLSEVLMRLPFNERVQSARVCRYWRNAATLDPRLWSRLIFVSERHSFPAIEDPDALHWLNPGFLYQSLIWSADHPLDLSVYGAVGSYLDAFCSVYPTIVGRLRSLHLEFIAHTEELARLGSVLSSPAPLLEHLTFFNNGRPRQDGLSLGDQFFLPRLKYLSLLGALPVLPDAMDPLTSVVKLTIGHQYDIRPSTSWTKRISILFPNLQELHIPNFGSADCCPDIHGLSHRLQSFTLGHESPSDRITQLPPFQLHTIPRVRLMWPAKNIAKDVLAEFATAMRPRALFILRGYRLVLSDADRDFYRECGLWEKDLRRVLADGTVPFAAVTTLVTSDRCPPDIFWPFLASLTAVRQLTFLVSGTGGWKMLTQVDSTAVAASSPGHSPLDAVVLEEDKEYFASEKSSSHTGSSPFVFAADLERVLTCRVGLSVSKDGSSTPKVVTRGVEIRDEAKAKLRVVRVA